MFIACAIIRISTAESLSSFFGGVKSRFRIFIIPVFSCYYFQGSVILCSVCLGSFCSKGFFYLVGLYSGEHVIIRDIQFIFLLFEMIESQTYDINYYIECRGKVLEEFPNPLK